MVYTNCRLDCRKHFVILNYLLIYIYGSVIMKFLNKIIFFKIYVFPLANFWKYLIFSEQIMFLIIDFYVLYHYDNGLSLLNTLTFSVFLFHTICMVSLYSFNRVPVFYYNVYKLDF